MIDGAALLVSLAGLAFLAWTTLANLRAGRLLTWAGPVIKREERPRFFWFGVGLAIVLAALLFIVAIAAAGKLAGWWTLDLDWSAAFVMDGSLVVMSFAVAGFLAWTALGSARSGEFASLTRAVARTDDPGTFWFAVGLSLALAAFFVALGVATLGKMAGWWEFSL